MINLSTRNLNITRNIVSDGSLVRKKALVDNSNLSASPRLINWVEPITISGMAWRGENDKSSYSDNRNKWALHPRILMTINVF